MPLQAEIQPTRVATLGCRLIVPHVRVVPEVRAALPDAEWIDVSADDEAYWRLLYRLWDARETVILVEQDILPTPDILAGMAACPADWCSCGYQFEDLGLFYGLGCAKFSGKLMAEYPDAIALVGEMGPSDHHPKRHWCPASDHRVLGADLLWRPIGDVEAGDQLIAFDEHAIWGSKRHYRNYQLAEVVKAESAMAETIRIAFDDAPDLYVTPDHPLLVCGRVHGPPFVLRWELARDLAPGRMVPKYLEPVQPLQTYEAGYLAGLFDGEGCLYGNGGYVSFSQRPGAVLNYGKSLLQQLCFSLVERGNGNGRAIETKVVAIAGGLAECIRFLSLIRPRRLLAKIEPGSFGVFRAGTKHRVAAVEPAGQREIRQVQTTTGTYLLEGMASHNCRLDDQIKAVLARRQIYYHRHPEVRHLSTKRSHDCG